MLRIFKIDSSAVKSRCRRRGKVFEYDWLDLLLFFVQHNLSMSVYFQLRKAILECIETVLLTGSGESLLELYNRRGQTVNAKLKTLIGQVH